MRSVGNLIMGFECNLQALPSDSLPTPPASPFATTPPTPLTAQAEATAQPATSGGVQQVGAGQGHSQSFSLSHAAPHLNLGASVLVRGLSGASAPVPDETSVLAEALRAREVASASLGSDPAADMLSPRARSSDFKLSARSQTPGSRSETTSAGSVPAASKSASASSAIAAAARANAAAANAIAESGALAGRSFSGVSGPRYNESTGNAVRTFTVPANHTSAQYASSSPAGTTAASYKRFSSAMASSLTGASVTGPIMAGAFSAGRAGLLAAGQASVMPTSAAAASSLPMTQQQRLNGAAFMTAMQQPFSSLHAAHGSFHGTAAGAQTATGAPNTNFNMAGLSQHAAANPTLGSGQGLPPSLNPNFRLPSGPAPFKPSLNPSHRAGPMNPNFVPSSASDAAPSGNLTGPGSHYSALGLASALPSPILTKPAGDEAPGNPLSPSYQLQGLHATALEPGTQAVSPAASQVRQHRQAAMCSHAAVCDHGLFSIIVPFVYLLSHSVASVSILSAVADHVHCCQCDDQQNSSMQQPSLLLLFGLFMRC